jgi:hypothetical protein
MTIKNEKSIQIPGFVRFFYLSSERDKLKNYDYGIKMIDNDMFYPKYVIRN